LIDQGILNEYRTRMTASRLPSRTSRRL